MKIENFGQSEDKPFTLAKKIDVGTGFQIFVMGIQPPIENNGECNPCIEKQTNQVFAEIAEILEDAGASFDDIVKANIYVTDLNEFSKVSPIRAKYFIKSKPVTTTVQVNGFTRKGARIEIEVMAVIGK